MKSAKPSTIRIQNTLHPLGAEKSPEKIEFAASLSTQKMQNDGSATFCPPSPRGPESSKEATHMDSPAMISIGESPYPAMNSGRSAPTPAHVPTTSISKHQELNKKTSLFETAVRTGHQYNASRNYAQALDFYGRALRYKHHTILQETVETRSLFADVLFSIGEIHSMSSYNEPAKAIQAFQFCLDLRSNCNGPRHPSIASVLRKLASVYAKIGENQTSADILEEALAVLLAVEDKSKALADTWSALGQQLNILGNAEDAQACFEEAAGVLDAIGTSFDADRQTPVMRNLPA